MIFQVGMNFIDSVARGWVSGSQVNGGQSRWRGRVGGGKTNLNRLFGVAMTSRSINTEPR